MYDVVDSLRKYQKIMILGVALGIIDLYMVPLDQIFASVPDDTIDGAKGLKDAAFDRAIAQVQDLVSPSDRIVAHLEEVKATANQHLDGLR